MLGVDLGGEVVEQRRRDLQDVAAALAHEMVMGLDGEDGTRRRRGPSWTRSTMPSSSNRSRVRYTVLS